MTNKDKKHWNSISSPYDGGRFISNFGYVQFRYRDENGKIIMPVEHRMNMEHTLGRKLFKTELVHHINGKKRTTGRKT